MADSASDRLIKEYRSAFTEFDDLTLGRWLAQTLSQLKGHVWRASHPLVSTYRLAADVAHERQIWLKRLANIPGGFITSNCCRSPMLGLFSRDVVQCGLICQHCLDTLLPFEDLPLELQEPAKRWSDDYAAVHAVAHWDDHQRKAVRDYDQACEDAAVKAEQLLAHAAHQILPHFLEHYPVIILEDQDECLEVLPEDIVLPK